MDKTKISATILLLITIAIVLSFNFDVTTTHASDSSILYVNESSTLSPTEQGITSSSLYALNNSYLEFDGVDDYVNTNYDPFVSGEQTLSFWFKSKTEIISNTSYIFSAGNSSANNRFRFFLSSSDNSFSGYFGDNGRKELVGSSDYGTDWNNIVAIRNTTQNRTIVYHNGLVVYNETTLYANPNSNSTGLVIGSIGSGDSSFNGLIDEVRVYNRSLEESEITEIYNSGRYKNTSLPSDGLVLYMPFEETNGTIIYDNSGLNNNGELIYE